MDPENSPISSRRFRELAEKNNHLLQQNNALIRENQEQAEILEALEYVNGVIVKSSNINEMLDNVLAAFLDIFDCDRAWITSELNESMDSYSVVRLKRVMSGLMI